MKNCKVCSIEKPIDSFEKTTKDGKCRRAVCKQCYTKQKLERAKNASINLNPNDYPFPEKCSKCGESYPNVSFKWRTDVKKGGWRSQCNSCFNKLGYSIKSRAKRRLDNETEFLRKNAETHLKWSKNNSDKIVEQKTKTKTIPDRRFKSLISYLKSKYKEDYNNKIDINDKEKLCQKMLKQCHYCSYKPSNGKAINGLDKVDPLGIYTDENTVPCCGVCNTMKLTYKVDEFIDGVRRIVNYRDLENTINIENNFRPKTFGGTICRRTNEKNKTDYLDRLERITLLSGKCYLCGRCPALGIDRVNSDKCYTSDNCKSCCTQCNYMKKDWTEDEVLSHVYNIYKNTSHFELSDTANMNSWLNGERHPVAMLDSSENILVVFPSATCASNIIGRNSNSIKDIISSNTSYRGHFWKYVPINLYKNQNLCETFVKELLLDNIKEYAQTSSNSNIAFMNDSGNIIGVFSDIASAAKKFNVSCPTIYKAVEKQYNSCGFKWKYIENDVFNTFDNDNNTKMINEIASNTFNHKKTTKPVAVVENDSIIIAFKSASEASNMVGKSRAAILKSITNNTKCCQYNWTFISHEEFVDFKINKHQYEEIVSQLKA